MLRDAEMVVHVQQHDQILHKMTDWRPGWMRSSFPSTRLGRWDGRDREATPEGVLDGFRRTISSSGCESVELRRFRREHREPVLSGGMRALPPKENPLRTIARLQMADDDLLVSLVQALLDSQC